MFYATSIRLDVDTRRSIAALDEFASAVFLIPSFFHQLSSLP